MLQIRREYFMINSCILYSSSFENRFTFSGINYNSDFCYSAFIPDRWMTLTSV